MLEITPEPPLKYGTKLNLCKLWYYVLKFKIPGEVIWIGFYDVKTSTRWIFELDKSRIKTSP